MTYEPILEIRDGRHLLQEMYLDNYISNDTFISGGPDGDAHSMVSELVVKWLMVR